jgi:ATP-dependent HslUV protease ATP-binding subunit HslU
MSGIRSFTPREIVGELDRYIVGQNKAKRAVAVALRNRWRRQAVPVELRDEISPKNILMIGPTGVGKTEIARRLAKLANAPFVKVEASKFTEVGYVGRDVEGMVRDLVEHAIQLVRAEELASVEVRAKEAAEDRLVHLLAQRDLPPSPQQARPGFGFMLQPPPPTQSVPDSKLAEIRQQLRKGLLDAEEVELDVAEQSSPLMQIFGGSGNDDMEVKLGDMLGQMPGFKGRTKRRKVNVVEAQKLLEQEEAQKLLDMDRVQREAVRRTEQAGIVFLDEIDKIAGRQGAGGGGGPDVSREGVQRDLLPIVEGSTVSTKYGPVKTDHVLFIAAGAFHVAKVSDLIPELQGRFPIRVELEPLVEADLVRILSEPKNALTKQYQALFATEGVELEWTPDAIEALARYAAMANERTENIGARRLHTILEALLEDLSFRAPEMGPTKLVIDGAMVDKTLAPIAGNEDLAKYVL